MRTDKPIPLAENERALMLLEQLRAGPASTVDLQRSLPLVHVARQVWELRHWYGIAIKTGRLPNGVAVYSLVTELAAPDRRPTCPKCHGPLANLEPGLDARFVVGRCHVDGRQIAPAA